MKKNTIRLVSLFTFLFLIPIAILIFLVSFSHAATYYQKYKEGVVVYTNIPPIEKGYKRVIIRHEDYNVRKNRSLGSFRYSKDYDHQINKTATWHGIDPYLVKAVIKVESNFNPKAVSPKGAMGVMQLMPETAKNQGVTNPFDPSDNITGGVRYLKKLLNMFNGNIRLALAGYNAGENAVVKYGYAVPPYNETINYVDKVLVHYNNLKDGTQHDAEKALPKTISERVDENGKREKNNDGVSQDTTPLVLANAPAGKFTLQIAAFSEPENAEELEQILKSKSFPAFVQKVDLPDKGTWYRVRVGAFETREEAKVYSETVKESGLRIGPVLITSNL